MLILNFQNVICTIQDKLKESKDFQDEVVAVEREIDEKVKPLNRINSIKLLKLLLWKEKLMKRLNP